MASYDEHVWPSFLEKLPRHLSRISRIGFVSLSNEEYVPRMENRRDSRIEKFQSLEAQRITLDELNVAEQRMISYHSSPYSSLKLFIFLGSSSLLSSVQYLSLVENSLSLSLFVSLPACLLEHLVYLLTHIHLIYPPYPSIRSSFYS